MSNRISSRPTMNGKTLPKKITIQVDYVKNHIIDGKYLSTPSFS